MALQKTLMVQFLDFYVERVSELLFNHDVCILSTLLDQMCENIGYRISSYSDGEVKEGRTVDLYFNYPIEDVKLTLEDVALDLVDMTQHQLGGWTLNSIFPTKTPSIELVRQMAFHKAEVAYMYIVDGWDGKEFNLVAVVKALGYELNPKGGNPAPASPWYLHQRKVQEPKEKTHEIHS